LDDWYSDVSLNAFGEEVTLAQYEWARSVDEWLAKTVDDFGKAQFNPAKWQLFLLKRRLDGLLLASWTLTQFVSNFSPDRLIVFARPPFVPDLDRADYVRPLHSLVAAAGFPNCKIEAWASQDGLQAPVAYPLESRIDLSFSPIGFGKWARAVARVLPRTAGVYLAGLRRGWPDVVSSWRDDVPASPRIAWIGNEDELAWVAPHLRRLGLSLRRGADFARLGLHFREEVERQESALIRSWAELQQRPEFWAFLDLQSPTLRQLVEPFFQQWVTEKVPQAWGQYLAAREWLLRNRIDLVMASALNRVVHSSVFGAAASLDLPRILYLHNPPGGPIDLPAQDAQDQIQADYYLVGGEGDVAYFRSFDERYGIFARATPVPVGSARLDALVRSRPSERARQRLRESLPMDPARPLILYVPTVLNGAYRYFNEGSYSDVAYVELLQRMLGIFAAYPVTLLYKPFPGGHDFNPILDFLAQRVPNARAVRGRCPLTDLMWVVDAIVVDFPSTAIAEAVLTDKPVLCYAGRDWARMLPDARRALAKRAWVSETPDEFEEQLRDFLRRGDFKPVSAADDEFVRLYVRHLNDGRSAVRAAEFIAERAFARRAALKKQVTSIVTG
jgi:hypothetical protein